MLKICLQTLNVVLYIISVKYLKCEFDITSIIIKARIQSLFKRRVDLKNMRHIKIEMLVFTKYKTSFTKVS